MINQLITFITSPKTFIQSDENPKALGILGIIIAALVTATDTSHSLSSLIMTTTFFTIPISLFLFLQSVFFDFIAQTQKLKAQSLNIFFWLATTLIPYAAYVPIQLLQNSALPILTPLSGILRLITTLYMLYLTFQVLKAKYNISTLTVFLIMISPIIIVIGTLFLFTLLATF